MNESTEKPSYEELETNAATQAHINLVRIYLRRAAVELLQRGEVHDLSKFSPEEVKVFTEFTPKLRGSTYGSEEYKSFLKDMGPALAHHYAENSHHPEFRTQDEEWRPIDGFPGYEVSNHGNVRSIDREVVRSGSKGNLTKKGRMLTANVTPKGYCRIQLIRNGKPTNIFVHVLVAKTFIPNPENKPEVNHIKGREKTNNHVSNLEWSTTSENLSHAYETGLRDPNVKYSVTCTETGVTTLGCVKMVDDLRARGYSGVLASGIWRAMNSEGGTHAGLHFTASRFEQWMNSPVSRMNLFDILEMFLDWLASTKRHADGDIYRSIEVNAKRFRICEDLVQIFRNTARDFDAKVTP